MSSEHSPTSPHDNPICIPTICLDSLNDSPASSDQFCPLSETETDQYFGVNVSNFLSWLSYFGSQRKFLVAAVLTANCEPGFRRALHLLNLQAKDIDDNDYKDGLWFKANDCDYISTLKSSGLPPAELVHQLLELIPHFSVPSTASLSCFSSRRISAASALDQTKDHDLLNNAKVSSTCENHSRSTYSAEKTQSLKKLYLNLISETINHGSEIFTLNHYENLYNLSDSTLKELVTQLPLGQLLIKVFLHPAFTRDDRNWLCSLLRAQQQVMNLESVAVKDDTSSDFSNTAIYSKSFDYLLELLSDLALILQSPSSTTFTSSLSHSLTSSGFLSGCGGSGSQYDLLSETTNSHSGYNHTNGGSQYGTLLTVPTPDSRASNPQFSFSGYSGILGTLEQRRLSDGPYILSRSLATSGIGNDSRALPSYNEHKHMLVSRTACSSTDCVLNTSSQIKPQAIARASLPNALTAQYPVETITEHASDSVSLSSASSNFSSNLDLRQTCHHPFGVSPSKSAGRVSTGVSNHEDSYSLPPSPPATAACSSTTSRLTAVSGTLTSHVSHNCPSPIPCSLACANYSLPERSFCDPSLFKQNEHNTTHDHCLHSFNHVPESSVFSYRDYSPEPQSAQNPSNSSEERASFLDPTSPMSAVPSWLKRLRLHKYANLFQSLSYEEFIGITEAWLEERNVTQGARTKLLLNIGKLSTRGPLLQQAEANLLQAPSTGPSTLSALRTCLNEIWSILHTPLKPCVSTSPLNTKLGQPCLSATSSSSCLRDHSHQSLPLRLSTPSVHATETNTDVAHAVGQEPLSGLIGQSASTRNQRIGLGDNTAYSTNEIRQKSEVECLPNLIMSCLTKVCSRLLVSSQPDVDCCEKFVQLLDIISEHPAFLDKQKSLTASWKQQMFNLLDTLPFHLSSDPSRCSRSVPRSYHGDKPFRKPHFTVAGRLHSGSKKGSVPCCSTAQPDEGLILVSTAHSDQPCSTSGAHYVDMVSTPNTLCIPVHPNHSCAVSGRAYHSVYSMDDSTHRRHSVPVNQTRTGPQPIKSCQGRRMPSPNPAFMPSRNTQFFFPGGQPQPSSSEADISQSAMQLPGTRFPSPASGFDRGFAVGPHRSLIPPATAPPTRMPSPSDGRHHGSGGFPLTTARSSMLLTVPVSHGPTSLLCPCASGTSTENSTQVTHICSARLPVPVPNSAFQTGYRSDLLQNQCHPMFSRPAIPSDSLAPPDCATFQSDMTELRQTCSSPKAPKNMNFNSGGSFNLVTDSGPIAKRFFDTVPQMIHSPGLSSHQSPSMVGFGSYGTSTYDPGSNLTFDSTVHSSVIDHSGASILSSCYHPSHPQKLSCPCVMSHSNIYEPNSLHVGAINDDRDWSANVTRLALSSIYAPTRDPTAQTTGDAIPNSDAGTDFIEHDLDLLTRKVTELAIGEFDSPVE